MDYRMTDSIIENYREAIISDTQRLIQSPSVIGDTAEGQPFGADIARTLELTLSMCAEMGFRTKNCDGYCGWAEIGSGDEMIGILCHLDVVPVGEGWTKEAFGAEIEDGKIYGRGSIDDKGPTVAALYATKAYSELHPGMNRRIRLIFGCNEENDWVCMDHYKASEEIPSCGFVPDATFPVIYAEKGILFPILEAAFHTDGRVRVKELKGGSSANMVAGSCSAVICTPEAAVLAERFSAFGPEDLGGAVLECEAEGEELRLKAKGLIAHGSTPWEGVNAISAVMKVIGGIEDLDSDQKRFVRYYNDCIGFETDGTGLCGCKVEDDVSGRLVNNAGTCEMDGTTGKICLNERYPVTFDGALLQKLISEQAARYGLTASLRLDSPPSYVPKDDPMIVKLMDVYRHYVDDPSEPVLIGGGTYARSIANCVAFGPLLPDRKELAHCPDEFVYIEDLILATKIYAAAIASLCDEQCA